MTAYWFSNLTVDYIKYIIPAFFTVMAIWVYDIEAFIDDGAFGATIVLFIVFGFTLLAFTYMASFAFKGAAGA